MVTVLNGDDHFGQPVSDLFAIIFGTVTDPFGESISTCKDNQALRDEFARFVATHDRAHDSAPTVTATFADEEFAGIPVTDLDGLLQRSSFVRLKVPVPIEEVDDGLIPSDLPGLADGFWQADVDLGSGEVLGWPGYDRPVNLELQLRDGGRYELLNINQQRIAQLTGHVPNQLLPGVFGEYLVLQLSTSGQITNWLSSPSLEDFVTDPASHLTYQILAIPSEE